MFYEKVAILPMCSATGILYQYQYWFSFYGKGQATQKYKIFLIVMLGIFASVLSYLEDIFYVSLQQTVILSLSDVQPPF